MKLLTILFWLSFSTNQNVCLVCGAKEAHVREYEERMQQVHETAGGRGTGVLLALPTDDMTGASARYPSTSPLHCGLPATSCRKAVQARGVCIGGSAFNCFSKICQRTCVWGSCAAFCFKWDNILSAGGTL